MKDEKTASANITAKKRTKTKAVKVACPHCGKEQRIRLPMSPEVVLKQSRRCVACKLLFMVRVYGERVIGSKMEVWLWGDW